MLRILYKTLELHGVLRPPWFRRLIIYTFWVYLEMLTCILDPLDASHVLEGTNRVLSASHGAGIHPQPVGLLRVALILEIHAIFYTLAKTSRLHIYHLEVSRNETPLIYLRLPDESRPIIPEPRVFYKNLVRAIRASLFPQIRHGPTSCGIFPNNQLAAKIPRILQGLPPSSGIESEIDFKVYTLPGMIINLCERGDLLIDVILSLHRMVT